MTQKILVCVVIVEKIKKQKREKFPQILDSVIWELDFLLSHRDFKALKLAIKKIKNLSRL